MIVSAVPTLVGGQELAKITVGTPMWRNDGRSGLKIAVLAISGLCATDQSSAIYLGKSPQILKILFPVRSASRMLVILAHRCATTAPKWPSPFAADENL